jgi:hypothetical protein
MAISHAVAALTHTCVEGLAISARARLPSMGESSSHQSNA